MAEKLGIFALFAASIWKLADNLGFWQRESAPQAIATPTPQFSPGPESIDSEARTAAKKLIIKREGVRNKVYQDTEGFLTVGIGHKVLSEDNLREGQYITSARVQELFAKDFETAYTAAKKQAEQISRPRDVNMIATLASVNFQLGTGWTREWHSTWPALQKGHYQLAISNLKASLWYRQTPVRVNDFINAIEQSFA
jgi:GH24 family phage-related lysozyme (muramidase)